MGASDSRKAGIPMVNQPTTVIWSGKKGFGSPISPITRARKTA